MGKTLKAAMGVSILAAGLTAGVAQAAFINGGISFSDGGITVPPVPSTSIVSQLTTVTQGAPVANACSGAFTTAAPACNLAGAPTAGTINLGAPAGMVYTYGGFTFTLSSVSNIVRTPLAGTPLGADALQFNIAGTVTGNGFDPTAFAGLWTGNGACTSALVGGVVTCTANVTASYSSSIVALGTPTVPEPATLGLMGIALAGLGFAARRKQA